MNELPSSPKSKLPAVLISGAAVLAVGAGVYAVSKQPADEPVVVKETTTQTETDMNPADTTAEVVANDTTETSTGAQEYEDGTYTAMGEYVSPGGPETISITLTIKDDIITAASADPQATLPFSVRMQEAFTSGFAELVVGQNIDDVELDKVSGSSLTPKGFNDAVVQIKAQAKI